MTKPTDRELKIERKAQLTVIRSNPGATVGDLALLFDMLALFPNQRRLRGSSVRLHHPNEDTSCSTTKTRPS